MTCHVITANALRDGLVVYQADDDSWTPSIRAAEVIDSDDGLEEALVRAQGAEENRLVVGPYVIEVELVDDDPRPVRYREYIRAYGPSTHPEFSHDTASAGVSEAAR